MLFMGILSGIGLSKLNTGFQPAWALVGGLVAGLLVPKRSLLALIAVMALGLNCGWWRGAVYSRQLSVYSGLQYQKITIAARAMNDGVYGKTKQLSFDANHIMTPEGQKLPGKIQLGGFGANAVLQGDELIAEGKLYPGFGPYQGRISYAKLTVIAHHPTLVSVARQKFTAGMQTALPEPLAPFAMGLLVGQRATLPDNVKQDLLMVGLTHIIAVSGYNLTIILQASRRLLGKASKRLATGLSFGLIIIFLLLAGASASIVRAAIVSTLSILASYYGRTFKPLNLIFLTASITALINPVYEWSDLSWYLSFLAFFGVMVVAPLLQARFARHDWHRTLIGAVALESICAELMSIPFILYIFGQMSLIGLPANVLVVTVVPLAMLLSLIAGLAGMFLSSLAGWFAWPAGALLNYMLDVAHLLARLPHIFIQNRQLSLMGMLTLYITTAVLALSLHYKTKQSKSATITDRNQAILKGANT